MIQIQSGLFDHMVLQRNGREVSDAKITGRTDQRGPVRVSVRKNGRILRGYAGRKIGRANGRRWAARLTGLVAGGPYDIELAVGSDRLAVADVLVGDVWILAGQSNMQGYAARADAARPCPQVRAFYMTDRWGKAQEPLHAIWEAVDPIHQTISGPPARDDAHGVGPGLDFALQMQRHSKIPQGLIACAHGGTSMEQWNPALKRLGGKSLYGATIRRIEKNGGKMAGVLWYQGENEAVNNQSAKYIQRMKNLIGAFRRDCGDAKLPVVMVQIGRYVTAETVPGEWNNIQDMQRRLPEYIRHLTVTPAIDLPLEDSIHIGVDGVRRLGGRMARAMRALRGDKTAGLPIALGKVAFRKRAPWGMMDVEVRFKNVRGQLRSGGYPMGFEVFDDSGLPVAYRTDLRGDRAIIHTTASFAAGHLCSVFYGRGINPAVNVTDSADQGLPMFQYKARLTKAVSLYAQNVRVSAFQPSAGKLKGLEYPDDLKGLQLQSRQFPTAFINLHPQIMMLAPEDLLVYVACEFDALQAMKLAALAGPDGPMKIWVDGRQVAHYPQGTNPAVADTVKSSLFNVKAGRHEVLIALGTNKGKAWGLFLRLHRLDLTSRQLRADPDTWVMPVWVG